jgi:hypothetical protein
MQKARRKTRNNERKISENKVCENDEWTNGLLD